MKINASPETIQAVANTFKLAALLDHRVSTPDLNTMRAHTEQVQRHNIPECDLLDAVQNFYDRSTDRPIGIGDIVAGARDIKRSRLDKESDAEREARRRRQDRKAEDDTVRVIAPAAAGPYALPHGPCDGCDATPSPFAYGRMNEPCPSCKAGCGAYCVNTQTGHTRRMPCVTRLQNNNPKPERPGQPMQRRRQSVVRASGDPVRAFSEPLHTAEA